MTYDIRAKRDPKNSTRQQGARFVDEPRRIEEVPDYHRRKSVFTNPPAIKNPEIVPQFVPRRTPR